MRPLPGYRPSDDSRLPSPLGRESRASTSTTPVNRTRGVNRPDPRSPPLSGSRTLPRKDSAGRKQWRAEHPATISSRLAEPEPRIVVAIRSGPPVMLVPLHPRRISSPCEGSPPGPSAGRPRAGRGPRSEDRRVRPSDRRRQDPEARAARRWRRLGLPDVQAVDGLARLADVDGRQPCGCNGVESLSCESAGRGVRELHPAGLVLEGRQAPRLDNRRWCVGVGLVVVLGSPANGGLPVDCRYGPAHAGHDGLVLQQAQHAGQHRCRRVGRLSQLADAVRRT